MRHSIFPAVAVLAAVACPADAQAPAKQKPIEVKVLVMNFDPVIAPATKLRLHKAGRWQDPRELAKGYAADVAKASGGLVTFKVVEWQDLDEFPVKIDGFAYDAASYMKCVRDNKGWHKPDTADYPKIIAKHKIVPRIESGEIDEVWWFGPPYAGFYESAMAGKGAFYINGGVFGADKVPCRKAFAVMGFNYERGVAEMTHDLCHRTESTMARIFGGWKTDKLDNDWARFAANAKQSGGVAGVGTCHYPPNGEKDYDYDNKRFVESDADDWINYPNLTGKKTRVNRETWGGPDYHRSYMTWWFTRLPRAPGVNKANGRLNNWWEYVFRFNDYDDRGKPVRKADDKGERKAAAMIIDHGGEVTIDGDKGEVKLRRGSALPATGFAVVSVSLAGTAATDDDVVILASCPRLRHLDLGGTKVTDAVLGHLNAADRLEWLSLRGTRIVGNGLASLARCDRLRYLELNDTRVALAKLPALPSLRELHLTRTPATDADLDLVARCCVGLKVLGVAATKITDSGKMRLPRIDFR